MSTEFTVRYFPQGFHPAENDIIVGRQKMTVKHAGNLRLNAIIDSYLGDYRDSTENKVRKSDILAEIYRKIREDNGRFVKLDTKEQKWYEVTKSVARERISQGFRDSLKGYYKSSLAYKKKRRAVKGQASQEGNSLDILSPGDRPKETERKVTNSEKPSDSTSSIALDKKEVDANDSDIRKEGTQLSTKKDDTKPSAPFLPRDGIKLMEEGFEPGTNDVIVGLRKKSVQHPGNQQLVEVVKSFLEAYKTAGNNKNRKSKVLNDVADALSKLNPPAMFVRLEQKYKRWYEIEAFYSREKISQTFRDIAQDGYRSANTYKNLKRRRSKSTNQLDTDRERSAKKDDNEPSQIGRDSSANRRLPPKKAAARKAAGINAETSSTSTIAAVQTSAKSTHLLGRTGVSLLTKKEQLALQIECLQKEMKMLEEEERKYKVNTESQLSEALAEHEDNKGPPLDTPVEVPPQPEDPGSSQESSEAATTTIVEGSNGASRVAGV